MIQGIFFDAAGVFYDRKPTGTEFTKTLVEQLGYATELSAQAKAHLHNLRMQATEGRFGYAEYWDQVVQAYGVADAVKRAMLVNQILENAHCVFAYPGSKEAVTGLKARGYLLGIITDTMYPLEWKRRWLHTAGVDEFFDVFTCSTVLGSHKPNPAMYLDALKQASLSPGQAAFVGHDAVELQGAQAVGMTTVAVQYEPQVKADYYCVSLIDLLDVPIFEQSMLMREMK